MTSSSSRNCGSILFACLAWTPKKEASNLDRSFNFPLRLGSPNIPEDTETMRCWYKRNKDNVALTCVMIILIRDKSFMPIMIIMMIWYQWCSQFIIMLTMIRMMRMIIINKPMIYMMVMMIFDNDFVNDGASWWYQLRSQGGISGVKTPIGAGKKLM